MRNCWNRVNPQRPLHNTPLGPISASGSKWYPRNIQYIPPVPFFAFPFFTFANELIIFVRNFREWNLLVKELFWTRVIKYIDRT